MNDKDRKPFWLDAKATDPKNWHEKEPCSPYGEMKCHRAKGHEGPCACEHHNVWNWPQVLEKKPE